MKTNREYLRQHRRELRQKRCDCGRPVVKYKGNAYVCAHCDAIEEQITNTVAGGGFVEHRHGRIRMRLHQEPYTLHLPAGVEV